MNTGMRFRGHETFFIRKGWISKGIKAVERDPSVFVSKDVNPMDVLGIGSNMVMSLRYWLHACGLTEEPASGRKVQKFTALGDAVRENDRYIEELGTLYLLQYRLATNKEMATSWYYFFNEFQSQEFTREDFVSSLQGYVVANDCSVASRSLNDDFACIINTYVPRYKTSPEKVFPENNIDCPFGELGLVDIVNKEKKQYRKAIPSPETFNPWVVLAVVMDQAGSASEVGLNNLLTDRCNIGRVFNLDVITMIDVLRKAEKTGSIKIIRTAGLDVVRLDKHFSFEDCVNNYYKDIAGGSEHA